MLFIRAEWKWLPLRLINSTRIFLRHSYVVKLDCKIINCKLALASREEKSRASNVVSCRDEKRILIGLWSSQKIDVVLKLKTDFDPSPEGLPRGGGEISLLCTALVTHGRASAEVRSWRAARDSCDFLDCPAGQLLLLLVVVLTVILLDAVTSHTRLRHANGHDSQLTATELTGIERHQPSAASQCRSKPD